MVTMSDDTAMPQDKPAKMGTILAPSAATSTTAIPAQSRFLFWRPLPLGVGTKFSGATTPSGGGGGGDQLGGLGCTSGGYRAWPVVFSDPVVATGELGFDPYGS
jgi:hypothetical protein